MPSSVDVPSWPSKTVPSSNASSVDETIRALRRSLDSARAELESTNAAKLGNKSVVRIAPTEATQGSITSSLAENKLNLNVSLSSSSPPVPSAPTCPTVAELKDVARTTLSTLTSTCIAWFAPPGGGAAANTNKATSDSPTHGSSLDVESEDRIGGDETVIPDREKADRAETAIDGDHTEEEVDAYARRRRIVRMQRERELDMQQQRNLKKSLSPPRIKQESVDLHAVSGEVGALVKWKKFRQGAHLDVSGNGCYTKRLGLGKWRLPIKKTAVSTVKGHRINPLLQTVADDRALDEDPYHISDDKPWLRPLKRKEIFEPAWRRDPKVLNGERMPLPGVGYRCSRIL